MTNAEVVVILPTIRVDAWLTLAVRSILDQHGVTLRLIVFHDGLEPDHSPDWAQDPRVTIMNGTDRVGLAAGLRTAIAASTEPYIARLDSDDLAMPNRLARQLGYLRDNPDTVLVGSWAQRIDEEGTQTGGIGRFVGPDVRHELLGRNVVMHSSATFRRDAYDEAGGYDPTLVLMADYDLWMRMGRLGPVAVLGERLISYRVHSNQMSRSSRPDGLLIRKVLASHRRLARAIGAPALTSWLRAMTWLGAQYANHWGLRRSRYDN